MIAHCYQIDDELRVKPLAPERVANVRQESGARIWVDCQLNEPSEAESWLDTLEVGEFSRRLVLDVRDRSGFYPLKNELLMVFPMLTDTGTVDKPEVDCIALLCRENLLLTMHAKPFFSRRILADLQESRGWLPECSIAGLVSSLMMDMSMEGLRHIAQLRESMLAVQRRMDSEPEEITAEEILEVQSDLLTIDRIISDQLPCVEALSRTERDYFKPEEGRQYVSCALSNMRAAARSLDRLEERVAALRSGFQMHAQDKTNKRLNVLTILSAVLMPITLLAGIWGMNFEVMPELKLTYAYPVAIGAMALIGLGMYFYFRKHGWFD
jgi:Mg2+ and Co2+ transporter CorA